MVPCSPDPLAPEPTMAADLGTCRQSNVVASALSPPSSYRFSAAQTLVRGWGVSTASASVAMRPQTQSPVDRTSCTVASPQPARLSLQLCVDHLVHTHCSHLRAHLLLAELESALFDVPVAGRSANLRRSLALCGAFRSGG